MSWASLYVRPVQGRAAQEVIKAEEEEKEKSKIPMVEVATCRCVACVIVVLHTNNMMG